MDDPSQGNHRLSGLDWSSAMVVPDTNTLLPTNLLRSDIATTLLHDLRLRAATVGISSLVEHEWMTNQAEQAEAAYRKAQREVGRAAVILRDVPSLPDRNDFLEQSRSGIKERLVELGDLIEHLPVQDQHWQEAGRMVIDKLPPSRPRDQQFKDSLLWRQILDLGQSRTVILITEDGGFLNDEKTDLALSLREECQRVGSSVEVAIGMKALLGLIQDFAGTHARLDAVRTALEERFLLDLQDDLWSENLRPLHLEDWREELFVTERPEVILVSIDAVVGIADATGEYDATGNEIELEAPYTWVQAEATALVDIETEEIEVTVDAASLIYETPHFSRERSLLSSAPTLRWGQRRVRRDVSD